MFCLKVNLSWKAKNICCNKDLLMLYSKPSATPWLVGCRDSRKGASDQLRTKRAFSAHAAYAN